MVEALVGRARDESLFDALNDEIAAPHLLDIEVLSVLRGLVLGRKLTDDEAVVARAHYFGLFIERHDTASLADRIWQLRHGYTAYDAAYIALAEALRAPLHTCDAKLSGGSHHAVVHLHGQSH